MQGATLYDQKYEGYNYLSLEKARSLMERSLRKGLGLEIQTAVTVVA